MEVMKTMRKWSGKQTATKYENAKRRWEEVKSDVRWFWKGIDGKDDERLNGEEEFHFNKAVHFSP